MNETFLERFMKNNFKKEIKIYSDKFLKKVPI